MKRSRHLELLSILMLLGGTACLPIPERYRDTPAVQINVVVDGNPLSNAWVGVMPDNFALAKFDLCPGAPIQGRTDIQGIAKLPAHRTFEFPMLLIGESPEWSRTWHLCVARDSISSVPQWRAAYTGHADMWDTVRVVCAFTSDRHAPADTTVTQPCRVSRDSAGAP